MTDFELIFSMLGEKVTTEISKKEKPKAMPEGEALFQIKIFWEATII